MYLTSVESSGKRHRLGHVVATIVLVCLSTSSAAQTSSTGAMIGVVTDPGGALVSGATVRLLRVDGIEIKLAETDNKGQFGFLLLNPGAYSLSAGKNGFSTLQIRRIGVPVTETVRLDLRLQLSSRKDQVQVLSKDDKIDLDDSALGRVVSGEDLRQLPLVSRNFTQIATIGPGV